MPTLPNAVSALLGGALVLAMCAIGLLLAGCPLHNPVPVEPDYPSAPRDAGHE